MYVEQADSYRMSARDATGRVIETTLAGITEHERWSSHNPVNAQIEVNVARLDAPRGNVALDFLDEPHLARLRVRAFDGEEFPATLDSAFRVLGERGATSLILDLRGNGGGVDEYGALLLSHLVDRPFRYFDRIKVTSIAPSFATWLPRTFESMRTGTVADPEGGYRVTTALHAGVGRQQPAANPFLGKLVVLIDGGSFSTTADVAAHLRSWRRATFVGEETGGGYAGNTSGLNALIVLPNSRLKTKVMMYGYWNAVAPEPGGRGVVPEHVVPTRVVDLLRGTDRAMDVARTLVP
jgi:C-terminal processing protease CtpA/Prc